LKIYFIQAEDGIRDFHVTGVQTCALPISAPEGVQVRTEVRMDLRPRDCSREQSDEFLRVVGPLLVESMRMHLRVNSRGRTQERKIGRASCRERERNKLGCVDGR